MKAAIVQPFCLGAVGLALLATINEPACIADRPGTSTSRAIFIAQAGGTEIERQVPVKEAVEQPDSPAADLEQGDAEAGLPAAEAVPPSDEPPHAEQPAPEP